MAEEKGFDLVEVSPDNKPPVVKLMDYGKYKYEQQKKANEARKKQKVIEIKEIKMRPTIDDHDYDVKMRAMKRFFDEGDKVKVTLRFRGREMAHQHLGMELLTRDPEGHRNLRQDGAVSEDGRPSDDDGFRAAVRRSNAISTPRTKVGRVSGRRAREARPQACAGLSGQRPLQTPSSKLETHTKSPGRTDPGFLLQSRTLTSTRPSPPRHFPSAQIAPHPPARGIPRRPGRPCAGHTNNRRHRGRSRTLTDLRAGHPRRQEKMGSMVNKAGIAAIAVFQPLQLLVEMA